MVRRCRPSPNPFRRRGARAPARTVTRTARYHDRLVDAVAGHDIHTAFATVIHDLHGPELHVLFLHGLCGIPKTAIAREHWVHDVETIAEVRRLWRRAMTWLAAQPGAAELHSFLQHGGYSLRYLNMGTDVSMFARALYLAQARYNFSEDTMRRWHWAGLDEPPLLTCPRHGLVEAGPSLQQCPECPCRLPHPHDDAHPGRPRRFCSSACRQSAYRRRGRTDGARGDVNMQTGQPGRSASAGFEV